MKNPPKGFIEDNIELLSNQTAFEKLVPKALKFNRCYVKKNSKMYFSLNSLCSFNFSIYPVTFISLRVCIGKERIDLRDNNNTFGPYLRLFFESIVIFWT